MEEIFITRHPETSRERQTTCGRVEGKDDGPAKLKPHVWVHRKKNHCQLYIFNKQNNIFIVWKSWKNNYDLIFG